MEKNEQQKKGLAQKSAPTNCDSCYHFVYDEDYGEYACEVNLDEDEMLLYSMKSFRACPYYQYNDEYISVRKQN
ncbi:MAG: hypothetical protein J6K61_01380 [Clostridia bacterium]|nr:hypothetical protein [Clostridia bacterium]